MGRSVGAIGCGWRSVEEGGEGFGDRGGDHGGGGGGL